MSIKAIPRPHEFYRAPVLKFLDPPVKTFKLNKNSFLLGHSSSKIKYQPHENRIFIYKQHDINQFSCGAEN